GYSDKVVENKKKELTWHFKAPNVHDFMWAADPDYTHVIYPMENGPELHFYYQKGDETAEWEKLPEYTAKAIEYMNTHFGVYPYEQFSVVQGGDGGMEYPMSTLITGHRRLGSLVGVTVHELIHSWYQGVLGTNESLYPWMDEGFTSYASSLVMQYLFETDKSKNPLEGSYKGYFYNVSQGEEPLTMHSDQYSTNRSYGLNAYSKGAVFLHQLSYVVGQETFMKGMRNYFNTWKFKHPDAKDFIRIMEKESGMVLDWYIEQFVYSTNSIDYSIENVEGKKGNTIVTLKRIGNMMMPIDLYITKKDGSQVLYYIPLRIMRGSKKIENTDIPRVDMDNWPWTNETYTMELPFEIDSIESMEIDTSKRLADVKPENNMWKK
ncbi:MAG: M1 family aminopeptidase, partial [Cyclobacteriaceae bacterium]|nr:M1 family aminopeptidase [Cyclobacteriaceae bacterium]